jgi:SCY1-like protein 1
LDGANDVRAEAFKVVDSLLLGLRDESKRMAKDEAERISAATCGINDTAAGSSTDVDGGSNTSAAPSSGSYLTGLSSWMTTSSQPTENPSSAASGTVKRPITSNNGGPGSMGSSAGTHNKPGPTAPKFSSLSLSDVGGASNKGGWSDDEDLGGPSKGDGWDDDDFGTSPSNNNIGLAKDDDDFFASFDSKPARAGGGRLSVPKKSGQSLTSRAAPQMQSSGMKSKKLPKPAAKKLPASDLMDDGWDDF